MNRPEFTKEQEYWICDMIGHWYFFWKNNMCDSGVMHKLGFAVENLKTLLCDNKELYQLNNEEEIKNETI